MALIRKSAIALIASLTIVTLIGAGCIDKPRRPVEQGNTNPPVVTPGNDQEDEEEVEETKEYVDEDRGFSLEYPEDVTATEQGTAISFSLWGPTQAEGTELFDGLALSVEVLPRSETQTVRDVAEADMDLQAPHVDVIEDLHAVSFDHIDGYEATVEGLGTFTFIYVAGAEEDEVFRISYIVADPGELGFQEMVDDMINSFRVL